MNADFVEYANVVGYIPTGICTYPNGDIYIADSRFGAILKQSYGDSTYSEVAWGHVSQYSMCVSKKGDIYVGGLFGFYKQTGGVGSWDFSSVPNVAISGMCTSIDNDIYFATPNSLVTGENGQGNIYKQTDSTGPFVSLGQTPRAWRGLAAATNGDIYASVIKNPPAVGDIYKQTGGVGNFVSIGEADRVWNNMVADRHNNIYAATALGGSLGGDGQIYMQTNMTGKFNSLNQTARNWWQITESLEGNLIAPGFVSYTNAPVYKMNRTNIVQNIITKKAT